MSDFFKQGSHATDSTSATVTLWAPITAGNYSTLRRDTVGGTFPASSASGLGYQVTSGKTFRATRFVFYANGSVTNAATCSFLHGTSDVGFLSAAAPSSPIAVIGSNTGSACFLTNLTHTGNVGNLDMPIIMSVPSGKYPTLFCPNGDNVMVIVEGFEE